MICVLFTVKRSTNTVVEQATGHEHEQTEFTAISRGPRTSDVQQLSTSLFAASYPLCVGLQRRAQTAYVERC